MTIGGNFGSKGFENQQEDSQLDAISENLYGTFVKEYPNFTRKDFMDLRNMALHKEKETDLSSLTPVEKDLYNKAVSHLGTMDIEEFFKLREEALKGPDSLTEVSDERSN
jgi:hypothetical protein